MHILSDIPPNRLFWLAIGFAGQSLFFMRFVVQWIQSERAGKSVMPVAFWYFSVVGGVVTLIYSIHIKDPVFIAGSSIGAFVYLRNLYFIFREKKLRKLNSQA